MERTLNDLSVCGECCNFNLAWRSQKTSRTFTPGLQVAGGNVTHHGWMQWEDSTNCGCIEPILLSVFNPWRMDGWMMYYICWRKCNINPHIVLLPSHQLKTHLATQHPALPSKYSGTLACLCDYLRKKWCNILQPMHQFVIKKAKSNAPMYWAIKIVKVLPLERPGLSNFAWV